MKKLINGIVEFRKKSLLNYREKYAHLALGQSPDTLFICCSDSRVAPNVFASTNPGDLFVIRNVGNMIPPCGCEGVSNSDESEAAAIEIALSSFQVKDIIVCGHSECAAMKALTEGREKQVAPNLRSWLRHGEDAIMRDPCDKDIARHNQISQQNVLLQLEHLATYPLVREKLREGKVKLHAWWFELKMADVYAFDDELGKFLLLDEAEGAKILERLKLK